MHGKCEKVEVNGVQIRAGYVEENKDVAFRGNVIYFEGLTDSMRNHDPLFKTLANEGYRVIAFDYMGQGGSEGKVNNTRIEGIPTIGAAIWKKYATDLAAHSKRTIIGWSTGGLAAYYAASLGQADRVILIAPGISPKNAITITAKSLSAAWNTQDYRENHPDGISPHSPTFVPLFAYDLLTKAKASRKTWSIPASVDGLVLLSDSKDKYVNAEETRTAVANKTSGRFEVV
ncbi:MAG: alpha/beta fold hydrolase [Bdellovibrionales bacterium]|nr:alpha/beta fold hydrolase [Bdellovibrionales bacterium]